MTIHETGILHGVERMTTLCLRCVAQTPFMNPTPKQLQDGPGRVQCSIMMATALQKHKGQDEKRLGSPFY